MYSILKNLIDIKMRSILILCILSYQCYGQGSSQANIEKEKFDITRFQTLKSKGLERDTLKDGSIITYGEFSGGYYTVLRKSNSHYEVSKQYFSDNLSLNIERHFFIRMLIGIELVYNHYGELINQTDYDAPFKFKLDELIKKIKNIYKIDLYNDQKATVTRDSSNPKSPYYQVYISSEGVNGYESIREITINGITGDIIGERPVHLTK